MEEKGKKLAVRIFNTGIGASKEDQLLIFKQSFFRSKEAKRVNPLGMGVGLLTAKTIVVAHRGHISFSSEGEEKGAEVRVEMLIK